MKHGEHGTRSNEVEFLETGPAGAGADDAPREFWRQRWRGAVVAAVALATVLTALVTHSAGHPSASPTRHPSAAPGSSSPPRPTSSVSGSVQSSLPPVMVTDVGRPLLRVGGNWELFGRGDGLLLRVQMKRGRITSTTIPPLQSNGPVSFLVGAAEAIIRPLDFVAGYAVPDGQPPRPLPARLSDGGPAVAGPDPGHVWVPSAAGVRATMALVDLHGTSTGVSIRIPADVNSFPHSDGSGGLLLSGTGGVYDARPGALHRVSTGALVAVGPSGWLAEECDNRARCTTVLIDRADGARHIVPATLSSHAPPGVISPDARTAAVFEVGPTGTITLELLDLSSGRHRRVDVHPEVDQAINDASIAWSPDSKWLFTVGTGGQLLVVDPHLATGGVLSVPLPPLRQLAIRRARNG